MGADWHITVRRPKIKTRKIIAAVNLGLHSYGVKMFPSDGMCKRCRRLEATGANDTKMLEQKIERRTGARSSYSAGTPMQFLDNHPSFELRWALRELKAHEPIQMTRLTRKKKKTPTHCSGYTNEKKKKAMARNTLSSVPRLSRTTVKGMSNARFHTEHDTAHTRKPKGKTMTKTAPSRRKAGVMHTILTGPHFSPTRRGKERRFSPPRVELTGQSGATKGNTILIIIRHGTKRTKRGAKHTRDGVPHW